MDVAERAARKRRGAWFTPPALVDLLVGQAVVPALLERRDRRPIRVLDPACGDGRLLAAAAAAGPAPAGVGIELVGIELDPATAATARAALPGARIVVGDGRRVEVGAGFDAVIGNPPYLGQLARATTRGGRSPLGGGPYADVAAEFLARAVALARPDGGRVALVLPQSILATRDTGAIRASVCADAAVVGFWWAGARAFDASVNVCIVVFERGRPQGEVQRWRGRSPASCTDAPPSAVQGTTWAPLLADVAGVPDVQLAETHGRLGDLATATAGFRQHFYGLAPYVGDEVDGPPLVTSGLIDPGRCEWGRRPARFAKRDFAAPRLDLPALDVGDPAVAAWVRQRLAPKVVVATQTRVIEAAVDVAGAWVPSVPVVSVHPRRTEDLWALGALLLAPPLSAWAARRYLGAGLGVTALKLSARQVLELPLPAQPWAAAVRCLRDGDIDGCGVEMCRAFELRADEVEPLLGWWRTAVRAAMVARAPTDRRQSAAWIPSSTP